MLATNFDRITKRIETLGGFNATPGNGCTRVSYSPQYRQAQEFLVAECEAAGLEVAIDAIGNMRARREGTTPGAKAVLSGSHIDTVPHGGNYDGVVGVVGALEALTVLAENNVRLTRPLELIIFVEEEGSVFGSTTAGSKALAGVYGVDDLKRLKNDEGTSFFDAAADYGLDPSAIGEYRLDSKEIKAMVELHIEQSVVLESQGLPLGVVQAIAGIRQFAIELQGVANHAGATPMNLRNDPLAAASRVISFVEEAADKKAFDTTVGTVGRIQCRPNVSNVIPGRVAFTVDARDVMPEGLETMDRLLRAEVKRVADRYGLKATVNLIGESRPITLPQSVSNVIENAAKNRDVPFLRMNSGAVHDACLLADITDVGMIFVPSAGGRSHVPEEFTRMEDIATGCDVLLDTLVELAR
ncbi:MAG: Zn-dependent hydrolase [Synergistota bacterium]|nr:Zn-dependent hydrolase [Synergistota bacterium]